MRIYNFTTKQWEDEEKSNPKYKGSNWAGGKYSPASSKPLLPTEFHKLETAQQRPAAKPLLPTKFGSASSYLTGGSAAVGTVKPPATTYGAAGSFTPGRQQTNRTEKKPFNWGRADAFFRSPGETMAASADKSLTYLENNYLQNQYKENQFLHDQMSGLMLPAIEKKYGKNSPEYRRMVENLAKQTPKKPDLLQTSALVDNAEKTRAKALEGLNGPARAAGEAGLLAGDMAMQLGAAAATGVPVWALQGAAAGGSAGQKAMEAGKSPEQATLYAFGTGGISAGIESFGGIGGEWGGKLLKTKAMQKLASKASPKVLERVVALAGTRLGRAATSALSEGSEEFAEYTAQHVLDTLMIDKETPYDIKEALYSAGIGAAMGGVLGTFQRPKGNPSERGAAKLDKLIAEDFAEESFLAGALDGKTPEVPAGYRRLSDGRLVKADAAPDYYQNHWGVSQDPGTLRIPMEKMSDLPQLPAPKGPGHGPAIKPGTEYVRPINAVSGGVPKSVDLFRKTVEDAKAMREAALDAPLKIVREAQEKMRNAPGLPVDGLPGQKRRNVPFSETFTDADAPPPRGTHADPATSATPRNTAQDAKSGAAKAINPEIPLEKQLLYAYANKEAAQKELDSFKRRSGITPVEMEQAKAVQKGVIRLDQLDAESRERVGGYAALLERLDAAGRPISEHNTARHTALDEQMAELLEGSDAWKDKKAGFLYSRETMERNMEDIIPDAREAARINEEIFAPIHQNEAKRQRFLNEWRGKVQALDLSAKESELVQMLGEGKISVLQIPKNMDAEKIGRAAAVMRDELYPELLHIANDALVRNGYRPVKPLKNYFPHFNDPSDPLIKALNKFGIKINPKELPTDIAGRTHEFKPGKQWFGNFMERKGDNTIYDALRGFDMYIEGISNVIHHTDDIQRLRAFEQAVRTKYSDSGITDRIKEIRKSADLTLEDQEEEIMKLLDKQNNSHLPHFVTNLRNYTDGLAGKKAIGDRNVEQGFGRGFYSTMQSLEGRVAANMVAVNPGSWLTNFIPLTQAGDVKTWNLIKGMWGTLKDDAAGLSKKLRGLRDGIADESDFLTNRRGSDLLARTKLESVQDALSKPMSWIDNFTSGSIVRAKYLDNLEKGMEHAAALRNADDYAARLIADRSKGALPTTFHQKNPIKKVLTMFQVEVNNQLSFLFKDMPKYARERGKLAVAASLAKYAVGAYIFNDVYQRLIGRRPALDPLGILNEAVGDASGYELPNITELPQVVENVKSGNMEDFQTGREGSVTKAGANLAENVTESIPFIGGIIGGGRVPVSSAIPDFAKLWSAASGGRSGDIPPNVAWSRVGRELAKPATYLLPPVGGGQIKKTIEGVSTVLDGGSYGLNTEGERQLQFPAERTIGNFAKGALFGKYALPEGQAYAEGGFKPMLTADETAAMDRAANVGIGPKEFLRLTLAMKEQKPDKDAAGKTVKSGSDKRRELLLRDATLTPEQKRMMDTFLIGDDTSPSLNYGSEDDFIISQMGASDRVLWKREDVREIIGDAETFSRVMEAVREVEPDKDKYGNAKPGSAKYKKIGAISGAMSIPYSKAGEVYEELFENKHSMSDFSSTQREHYERGPAKIGVTEEQFIDCMNIIRDVKAEDDAGLNEMRVQALAEAGYPKTDAQAFVKSMFQDKYSLEDLSEKTQGAYTLLKREYKMTEKNFIDALNAVQNVEGVKGKNGKTISGSQKKARFRALTKMRGWNAGGAKKFLMAVYGYKDKDWV